MPPADPIRQLQAAARLIAAATFPGVNAATVQVLDCGGRVLAAVAIPPGAATDSLAVPEVTPGWIVDGGRASYDGQVVAVGASRLKLLAVLAKATDPLTAKELNKLAFGGQSNEESVRHHVRKLRDEVGSVFADFEGEVIANEGGGYTLALK